MLGAGCTEAARRPCLWWVGEWISRASEGGGYLPWRLLGEGTVSLGRSRCELWEAAGKGHQVGTARAEMWRGSWSPGKRGSRARPEECGPRTLLTSSSFSFVIQLQFIAGLPCSRHPAKSSAWITASPIQDQPREAVCISPFARPGNRGWPSR